jgi:hypothetical protein
LKQDADYFAGCEAKLIYIARKLNDALRLEELLTESGFDYGVEPDRYRGGFIFQTERVGAFFYVKPEEEERARAFLAERGFRAADPLEQRQTDHGQS